MPNEMDLTQPCPRCGKTMITRLTCDVVDPDSPTGRPLVEDYHLEHYFYWWCACGKEFAGGLVAEETLDALALKRWKEVNDEQG